MLSEIIALGVVYVVGVPEIALLGAVIAGISGFSIAYATSQSSFRYRNEIEEQNIQLEIYQRELQMAKGHLEERVEERTKELLIANQQIQNSLEEKDVLLKEIHHRVKNNLQIVSSLLYLQSRRIREEEIVALFEESRQRILAMALVHENLYSSDDIAWIDFSNYVQKLVLDIAQIFEAESGKVVCEISIDPGISLDIDYAIPCGLIVNELVSNAYKHAFKDRQAGVINVRMLTNKSGEIELFVTDNGCGLPAGFDPNHANNMGLQIVHMLVNQLNGQISFESKDGTNVKILIFATTTKKST
ncbi:MAG: hypothetical protein ISR58_07095 [Anaerolineales bacterium]|nr:hypothetical protein [Anaerolineales bacterium]